MVTIITISIITIVTTGIVLIRRSQLRMDAGMEFFDDKGTKEK